MKRFIRPPKSEWEGIAHRPLFNAQVLNDKIRPVLDTIKATGDSAVLHYTRQFDGVDLTNMRVTQEEFDEADRLVEASFREAVDVALKNIETFHVAQKEEPKKITTSTGVTCWRVSKPIEKVGLYVPGGTAPLFSTVLMLAVPATVAGCKEIVLCTPPNKEGKINPYILYAATKAGVRNVFKIGGAQAIAAMAYGTETVPAVYKIFGPGNQFVTAAKQMVSQEGVAIDMPAGPSEVQVIADEHANPDFIAADLLSQAEHGVDSQVLFLTTSESLLEKVEKAVDEQLAVLPRKEIADKALQNSRLVVLDTLDEVIAFTNFYAPEHLVIQTEDYHDWIDQITNAGSVFLGPYTPESAGDYASGTNHTLPTNGYARAYSGVSLDSYIKKITFQEITAEGIEHLGPTIELMAEKEELFAHRNAVTVRRNFLKKG